jgi:hypothetical protein
MMPKAIYAHANTMSFTKKMSAGPQYDRQGNYRAADQYQWGDRLQHLAAVGSMVGGQEARRGRRTVAGRDALGKALTNPEWSTSKWDGMFRSGEPGHSQYLTIRTMTPTSPGWNIPARLGHGVAREVTTYLASIDGQQQFEEILAHHLGLLEG